MTWENRRRGTERALVLAHYHAGVTPEAYSVGLHSTLDARVRRKSELTKDLGKNYVIPTAPTVLLFNKLQARAFKTVISHACLRRYERYFSSGVIPCSWNIDELLQTIERATSWKSPVSSSMATMNITASLMRSYISFGKAWQCL